LSIQHLLTILFIRAVAKVNFPYVAVVLIALVFNVYARNLFKSF
jgi:hypothetical protein